MLGFANYGYLFDVSFSFGARRADESTLVFDIRMLWRYALSFSKQGVEALILINVNGHGRGAPLLSHGLLS